MTLTRQVRLSDAGTIIRRGLQERLDTLRIQGDAHIPDEVNLIRVGRIQEVKALLALFDEPIITQ